MPIGRKQFKRTVEDFTCERCGQLVKGNGYTNHCPQCFTSKHVDEFPGDRAATCGGLMPPVHISFEDKHWVITQQCERCGLRRRNKVQAEDNMEKLALVMKQVNELPTGM
jgi:DNA-directed RNA polymerase subunit RPC12/RpoP